MTTVLVTGATGLIGSALLPALASAGHAVRAQYRGSPGSQPSVDWCCWDFSEARDPAELVAGCDAVVHLAAELARPVRMMAVNHDATLALVEASQKAGARYFAYASSIVVYGSPRQASISEDSPVIDPNEDITAQYRAEPYMREYARTKALAEQSLRRLNGSMHVDILRPTVVVDADKSAEAFGWSRSRRIFTRHRRTQYIDASDVAGSIVHLMSRTLGGEAGKTVEDWILADDSGETFADVLGEPAGHRLIGKLEAAVLGALDLAKDMAKHRTLERRYPLGMLKISNAKLVATGYRPGRRNGA